MTDLYKSKAFTWALLLIFTIAWFYMLDLRTLVPTDEGRYAEMAREMVASGDWITTRLNGIKYFEKPPLQTWMNALTFELFGMGEWQARFWTGLSGFFGIVMTAYAGYRVFNPRVGFYAGLVLASSWLWAALGHVNTLDMGLSGMMTLALCALLVAQRDNATASERRTWMLACWAGMALAVMSKGLIGLVLPGAVLVIYTVLARDWSIWQRLHLGKGLLLFFAITTPWFILVSLKNPEFPRFFFIHEHFERFLTKTHHREGPLYYFVPLLVVGLLPWLGVFVQSVVQGMKHDAAARFQPKKMLVIWAGFIFFFQHLQLQAAVLHPADLSGAGLAAGRVSGTRTAPQLDHRRQPARRAGRGRHGPDAESGDLDQGSSGDPAVSSLSTVGAGGRHRGAGRRPDEPVVLALAANPPRSGSRDSGRQRFCVQPDPDAGPRAARPLCIG
ncbi:ArnT family glycosyltransferase [Undibacterium arcticum]|uniref:ArnT family glycosyltransferase n=1 Tax=Undibacterium arcticum TaxID=1762892 RepID=UPI0036216500